MDHLLPLLLLLLLAGDAAAWTESPRKLRFRRESGDVKGGAGGGHALRGRPGHGLRGRAPVLRFLYRVLHAEDPDLVVFTGDNIHGVDSADAGESMDEAIAPAIDMNLHWAAVIGNHDQEGTLSGEGVMRHLVGMKNSLSRLNPDGVAVDGYGNYNLEVHGVQGTSLSEKSVFNLYFLDTGDYSTLSSVNGYGWIKSSQQAWFRQASSKLQVKLRSFFCLLESIK
ncbi:hypothetical protein ACP70R_044910 [Stipagrostis hirtigluma subsp. patula]